MSHMVSEQTDAERARRLIEEGIGGADHVLIDTMIDPQGIEHQRGHEQGVEAVHGLAAAIHAGFPDVRITVEDIAVAGDRVWVRSRVEGTNTGPFRGYQPTGREMVIDLFDVVRIEDGRVVEHWGLADQMGVLIQLGHLSAPPPDGAADVASTGEGS
jgi:predicted ester cyclase